MSKLDSHMTILMEDMTWVDMKDRVASCKIVIVPIGSTEQHGMHLPVKVDVFIADQIAQRAAEKASAEGIKVTVAPAIPFGTSAEHWKFPATISLEPETQLNLLKEICSSLVRSGFEKIVILNGHGGNTILNTALVEIWRETGAHVVVANWWNFATRVIREVIETEPDHACELETSMMMALDAPVKMDRAKKERIVSPSEYCRVSDMFYQAIMSSDSWYAYSISETGSEGDPTKASREKGERILNEATDQLVKFLSELHQDKFLPRGSFHSFSVKKS